MGKKTEELTEIFYSFAENTNEKFHAVAEALKLLRVLLQEMKERLTKLETKDVSGKSVKSSKRAVKS